jgi:iron complex outermembrane receptor protein
MFKKTQLASGVGLSVIAALGLPLPANAQEDTVLEEIVITGSAIRRPDLEGSLPLQIFSREDMDRSGTVTTGDLVASMPVMQGFTTPGDSVGGSGGGIQTASIHDLGEQYTLSLLNGRRIAAADSGSTIDISTIPMSALETVEVLTDGASALYGSDAIAGVINFRLKDEVEGTTISSRFSSPQEGAGETFDIDLVTGFGNFDTDGFSVVAAFNHHEQEQLRAADRDFAKTGIITFFHSDFNQQALFFNGSGNAIPGNARVRYIDTTKTNDPLTPNDDRLTTLVLNPFFEANGSCASANSQITSEADATSDGGDECWFDYTSTIEIVPESERDSIYLNGKYQITENLTGFATAVLSENSLTARIAPYPTGYVPLPVASQLVQDYVAPYLTADQLANIQDVAGRWRGVPAGNRTTEYVSESTYIVAGVEGITGDINYSGALTRSENDQEQNYPTGWLIRDPFVDLVASGGLNIFVDPADLPDSEKEALAGTVYNGNWDSTKVTVNAFDASGSKPLFDMGGGEATLALGMDYRDTTYKRSIAEANANEELLFLSPDTPYDMNRAQWGVFSEFLMPITDTLELTASLRYDNIDAIDSKGFGTIGETMNDTTYKISGRWNATDSLAFRAAFGTGFKAPSMREIAEPRSEFGVTSDNYTCPFAATDPLAQFCLTGQAQYTIFREGFAGLEPEKSEQYSVGFVLTPGSSTSITVDYWSVEIIDVVERLTEQQIFADPVAYRNLFTTKTNLATNEEELAIIQAAVNFGSRDARGVDYNVSHAFDFDFGLVTGYLAGTYLIESQSSLNGSSLGRFGADNEVSFRNRVRAGLVLEQEIFSHNLNMDYRSGYTDQAQSVNLIDSNGVVDFDNSVPVQFDISSYATWNYQAEANLMEDKLSLTLGINNLFDEEPPLSLRTGGAGHQVGWDPRYVDAYGRTAYLQAAFTF